MTDTPDQIPRRVQRRRTRGWRLPANTVCVHRPTRWGNPYTIGGPIHRFGLDTGETVRDAAHAVALYRALTTSQLVLADSARRLLAGRNLACWCPLDQPCHADVLLAYANPELDDRTWNEVPTPQHHDMGESSR
jgi:hypothetical protein